MSAKQSIDESLPINSIPNVMTLQSYILSEELKQPGATGSFSWIFSALAISSKMIAAKLRRARLEDILGSLDSDNVQGERQEKLDVISNEILIRCLGSRSGVAVVASEENEEPMILQHATDAERPYCVLFDPLDGSSNIDVCGGVGTIFSILSHDRRVTDIDESILQAGTKQVAAGYVLYGSSTVLVLTTGNGVHMFVLDPSIGAFMLVQENLRIPKSGKIYSLNEGNRMSFPEGYQNYLAWAQQNGYSLRYAGAMVADVHRTLLKGGVFLYPPSSKEPEGKLRLLYEGCPMAMLVEQAGGAAAAGDERILDIQPQKLHQRTGVLLGSPGEMEHVTRYIGS
jgi:fructose-1,6-bisphosphatase I